MKQEIKNMEMVLKSFKESLSFRNFEECKTLANVYERMVLPYKYLNSEDYSQQNLGLALINQLKLVKEYHDKIINTYIPLVISEGDYSELNKLQITSEKLSSVISGLSKSLNRFKSDYGLKEEQIPSSLTTELLECSIKGGTLVALVNEDLRGTGKTTEVIKQANNHNATIVVSNHHSKQYVDSLSRELNLDVDVKYISSIEAVRGVRFKYNKFIVDEMVDHKIIKELIKSGNQLIGGFINLFNTKNTVKSFVDHLKDKLKKVNNELDVLNYTYIDKVNKENSNYIKLLRQRELLIELIEEENNK